MISGNALTGRDTELAALRRALSGVGNYAGVVIAGPAGVGKTRLAREVLSHAAAAGTRTNWVVGTSSARPIPLGAFTASLGDTVTDPAPSVRRVINSLVAQQRQGRVLIGVDDAHLLDGFSAHVLHQLAQTREARLVVTLRTGGGEPDAVTALWKDGLLARLDLEPLSAAATREMVESALGGAVDGKSAQRFWRLTGGNALFIQQLLKDQVAAGRIRQVAGVWMWDGDVAVSQSMSDLVGNQLDQLSPELAMVVDILSQCEPLSVDVLCDLVTRDDLEAAEQLHLVAVERVGNRLLVRLAHPLFGELRRAAAGEMYLSKIRGRLAQQMALHQVDERDGDPQGTVRRAQLTLDSDLAPDPDLYLDAAQHAMRLLDLDLAERFAAAAAKLDPAGAAKIQATNMVLKGQGERADAFLRTVTPTDAAERREWALMRAANLVWMLGRPTEAAPILAELASEDESDADRAARLALEACVDVVAARCELAEQKSREAMESGTLSDLHAIMASVARVMSCGALGYTDDMAAVANAAIERATASFETAHLRFWFGGVYLRACRLTGRIDEARRASAMLATLAKDAPGLPHANLMFLMGQGELMRGELSGAGRLLHEALATAEHHGAATLRPACYFGLTEVHAKLGEADAAAEMLANARLAVKPDYLHMQTALAVSTGWSMAAAGRLHDAITTVMDEARVARGRDQPTHELACLQAAVQWGIEDGLDKVAARARELADRLSLPIADIVATHAESLLAKDGEALLKVSGAYKDMGDRCTAADAAAQAGVALAQAQSNSRATLAASTAQQLRQEVGGLSTPATRSPITPTPLTGRQREIAELVAVGLSNKEIADRLVTSVRTVEGHLYRACQRVGAKSRSELAAIMRAGSIGMQFGDYGDENGQDRRG